MRSCVAILVVVLIAMLVACSATRAPTAADQQAILTVLVQYEESHGVAAPEAGLIRPEIRVEGTRAWANYAKTRLMEQICVNPIEVQLEKEDADWVVVSEKQNWPWWWHVVNHTVGLK